MELGSGFKLFYNNTQDDNAIGTKLISSVTETNPLAKENKVNNPFKGTWNGKLSITNGNEICEEKLF